MVVGTSDPDIARLVLYALQEDLGGSVNVAADVSSAACIPKDLVSTAEIKSKQAGVLSGSKVAHEVFHQLGDFTSIDQLKEDGDAVKSGDTVMRLSGSTPLILIGERTALNFMQHLSGIATLTASFVAAVKGTTVKIVDTRKTIPGLRKIQKAAVLHGGGINHRMGLFDAVLLKDNHISGAGGVTNAVARAKARSDLPVQVEVETEGQLVEAIKAGADSLLLDNRTPDELVSLVQTSRSVNPSIVLEASGGITLGTVATFAQSGVDRISIGALTHSAPALDLSLKLIESRSR